MSAPLALDIRGLSKTYDNGFEALKGVDLTVPEGEFFALLGPNGAGKSTTIGILSSLVRKSAGTVRIFDVDIDEDFPRARTFIGLVPQEFNFGVFDKVEHIVVNQAGYYGIGRAEAKARAAHYLDALGLYEKRRVQARMLSGGMKRRLMIARALIHQPRLLILDEPTAGVDIELRRSMWQFLRQINEQGTTIILTTHYLEEAESLCRHIAIIDRGRLIENASTGALLARMQREAFVLDLRTPVERLPQVEGYAIQQLDACTLEVSVERERGINALFAILEREGVQVLSLRNKSNRLEELFLSLVEKSDVA